MMQMNHNSPFYTTPWNIPPPPQPKKKVVSIPVHFVGSGSDLNSERIRNNNNNTSAMKIQTRNNNSAIKIQKVVRGFLVRNSMRRIKAIRVELEKIEEKVCDVETKELIKREQKERLKVSESIMNLLLKLDSVRVLNYYSGVRDYRKSVIKKAIALQELVDQIQMVGPTHQDQPQLTQVEGEDFVEGRISARDSHLIVFEKDSEGKKMEGWRDDEEEEKKLEVEEKGKENEREDGVGEENGSQLVGSEEDANGEGKKMETSRDDDEEKVEVEEKDNGEGVEEESVGTSMVEEVEENCLVKEEEEQEEDGCKEGRGEGDYENKTKELLERMMEDNERMMGMMAQLFERNEMQTKLLSSLSHRVEQLERAYACDKVRRKKRRNADTKHKQTH